MFEEMTSVSLTAAQLAELAGSYRSAELATTNTIAVMDGAYMVSVSAENRAATGVKGGDEVDVDIELDTAPRTIDVPEDLAAALDAEPRARATFDALSNSNKGWHVLQVTGAKTDETRQRRIAKSVASLREGKPR